jgi:hypothetical protein
MQCNTRHRAKATVIFPLAESAADWVAKAQEREAAAADLAWAVMVDPA